MTDNGDGTYTYNHTISRPGIITINVMRYAPGGAYIEWYTNRALTGDADRYNCSWSKL